MADQSGRGSAPREEFREQADIRPSTGTDPVGEEGSILEGDEGKRTSASQESTGAGAEATEGMHATKGQSRHDKTALANKPTGRSGSGDEERNASEPMDRTKEHKGSYGGEGGSPRTSSNERESPDQGTRK